jgi:hypothetical protein
MSLKEELIKRFGESKVTEIQFSNPKKKEEFAGIEKYSFLALEIQKRSKIKVLMTNGLSDYKMPVLEKFLGREFNELYFCLPSYWDLDDHSNENMNWVFEILYKLHKHVIEKETWFGLGHTIPFKNPIEAISATMNQKYFFYADPIFLKDELQTLKVGDKNIHFLSIIPIFEDEFDYKIGKGTYKFQKKMAEKDVSELLDDFRGSALKSNWKLFSLKK